MRPTIRPNPSRVAHVGLLALFAAVALATRLVAAAPSTSPDVHPHVERAADILLSEGGLPWDAGTSPPYATQLATTLRSRYREPNQDQTGRLRILWGLSTLDVPEAGEVLAEIAEASDEAPALRKTAVAALALHQNESSAARLLALLSRSDVAARQLAAYALARAGRPAQKPLESRLEEEHDLAVRETIQQALTKIGP